MTFHDEYQTDTFAISGIDAIAISEAINEGNRYRLALLMGAVSLDDLAGWLIAQAADVEAYAAHKAETAVEDAPKVETGEADTSTAARVELLLDALNAVSKTKGSPVAREIASAAVVADLEARQ